MYTKKNTYVRLADHAMAPICITFYSCCRCLILTGINRRKRFALHVLLVLHLGKLASSDLSVSPFSLSFLLVTSNRESSAHKINMLWCYNVCTNFFSLLFIHIVNEALFLSVFFSPSLSLFLSLVTSSCWNPYVLHASI